MPIVGANFFGMPAAWAWEKKRVRQSHNPRDGDARALARTLEAIERHVRCDQTRENTHLQFIERETAAEASLEVVSLGRRVHDRAKSARDRARERLLGLELARVAARLLAAGCARRKQQILFFVSLIASAIAAPTRARARGKPLTAALPAKDLVAIINAPWFSQVRTRH